MRGLSNHEPKDRKYAHQRFGGVMSVLAPIVLDVREMRKIEEMLESSDKMVMAFKDSHLNAVGSVAVSAAIISQLSSTTLQMPGLSNVHWTAPGLFIASLLFSVLAVILACIQQQILGMLNNPKGVRMWLSNGHFYPPHARCHPRYDERGQEWFAVDERGRRRCDNDHSHHHFRFTEQRAGSTTRKRQLQVSLAALQLLSLPHKFLSAGVVCFLGGLALYLGFAWRQDLDDTPARNNNEAVLVMFVAVASTAVLGSVGVNAWKLWEVRRADARWEENREFDGVGEEEREEGVESEGSGGEEDAPDLRGKGRRGGGRRGAGQSARREREWQRHEEIAAALEAAAKAHRKITELMKEEMHGE